MLSDAAATGCNNNETKTAAASDATSEVKTEEAWVPVDSAAMMKAMMDYGTLGKMHQMMAKWDGTWNGETTMWEHEGAAPSKINRNCRKHHDTGRPVPELLNTAAMRWECLLKASSVTGYDNATKQFVSTWVDTWSTGITTMAGPWDEASKTLTITGTMPDIFRPEKRAR